MGAINSVSTGANKDYSAASATEATKNRPATAAQQSENGDVVLTLSTEARERLDRDMQAGLANAPGKEEQEATIQRVAALRFVNQGPVVDLGSTLFSDPYTNDDASALLPLLHMTAENSQEGLDSFSEILHQVLRDGTSMPGQYDNSDTSEAMALALTQAKLQKLVEKKIAPDQQQQASQVVQDFIAGKVAQRETILRESSQASLDIARQYGSKAQIAEAQSYLDQVKQGTSRQQSELKTMLAATANGGDVSKAFTTFTNVINSSSASGDQSHLKKVLQQLAVYRQQWDLFNASLN